MSEANAPFNRPEQNESADSAFFEQQDSFVNPFGVVPDMDDADIEADSSAQSVQFDTSKVGSETGNYGLPMPDARSGRSSIRSAANTEQNLSIAPEVENWLNSPESTDLADLISLIQELNQCNSILLDRVSQLEEALERSQNALKAEVKRSQDHTFASYNPELVAAQDLAVAQDQAIELYNQLEFVHQTSQRQQILIETLTGQLETSQERVAQLEREAALVQQRYNEQTQLLAQAENNCRDLQARLHRQQRYTLQFKVALEKSLDVSTAHYEPVPEVLGFSSSPEGSFLPKVQHIEPWTSPIDISPARFPWMKLSSEALGSEPVALQTDNPAAPKADTAFEVADIPTVRSRRSKLASVKLPGFAPADMASASQANLNPEPVESVDLSAVPDEKLMQKLDSMVQPLADLLAEAVLTEVNSASSPAADEAAKETAEPTPSSVTNTPVEYFSSADYTANPDNADDLLSSVMADAEDALWQDLARLIDVSTEDVVKASLSGDLSAFESINFDALQPSDAGETTHATHVTNAASKQPKSRVRSIAPVAPAVEPAQPAKTAAFGTEVEKSIANHSETSSPPPSPPSVFGANPGWPAPLIYPTRPAQKRRSLAAVDLPSFLQQQPGPLPT